MVIINANYQLTYQPSVGWNINPHVSRVLVTCQSSTDWGIDPSVNHWSTVGHDSTVSVLATYWGTVGPVLIMYQWCIGWASWVLRQTFYLDVNRALQHGQGKGDYPPFWHWLSGLAESLTNVFLQVLSAMEHHNFQWEISLLFLTKPLMLKNSSSEPTVSRGVNQVSVACRCAVDPLAK